MRHRYVVTDWLGVFWGLAGASWLTALMSSARTAVADLVVTGWTANVAGLAARTSVASTLSLLRALVQLPTFAGLDLAAWTAGLVGWQLGAGASPNLALAAYLRGIGVFGNAALFAASMLAGVLITRILHVLIRLIGRPFRSNVRAAR